MLDGDTLISRLRPAEKLIGIAAVLAVFAAFLPWAHALFFSVAGIEGDGRITFAMGALGILLLVARRESGVFIALQLLLGVGTAVVGIHDLISVESSVPANLSGVAGAGSGLYLTAAAGVVWTIAALALVVSWPGLTRPTPRAESEPLKLDAPPTAGSFGSRMPRGAMIAIVAFVLGGGVATVVALVRNDSSTKGNLAGGTTTDSGPGDTTTESGPDSPVEAPLTTGPGDLVGLGFQSPTGNLQCGLAGAAERSLGCERMNDGLGVELEAEGPPTTFAGGGSSSEQPILPYGETWTRSFFTCESSREGIRCLNPQSGWGFFLSRTTFTPLGP